MRVSVFDPHAVIHKGLSGLLPEQGHSIVSQALDGRNAVKIVRESLADLVITEIQMPHVDGIALLEQLASSNLNVPTLVFTANPNPTCIARSVVHGARDYVLKSEPIIHLLRAMNGMALNQRYEPSRVFRQIKEKLGQQNGVTNNPHELTSREFQVWQHLGFGLSNREIAKSLNISVETIKEHVQNILRKLDAKDRTAAAVAAIKEGIV